MAVLRGFFNGTMVPVQTILTNPGVDTFLVVTNNGPGVMGVVVAGVSGSLEPANSRAFFVPTATIVDLQGPVTASWELAVPG